ncbi:DUF1697 domain-containing protein [Altererythrobacter arenosus]|uniref:DUF1697 domain-containing protein n=1 Tax=Altererythrobacter arenosus TaxID=3032592 RepID=A0ABY8FST7_9SPHN|nr:DUF1697 domain-containing protein [Altererythrobacter sp. CAU 1644]WFL77827.1 DUF1697 domain-containing protein [Altererythrobacter sp. CAU 1644]
MARYLALLGSINVGGNRIKMEALRGVLDKAGFGPVETVAASGNVIFSSSESRELLADRIAEVIARNFQIASVVTLRTLNEVRSAVRDNPFHGEGSDRMVHTIFLPRQPSQESFDTLLQEHRDRGAERLALGNQVLYLDYVHGVGVSDLTGRFLEIRLGCRGTARNMTSLKRIIAKMEASE